MTLHEQLPGAYKRLNIGEETPREASRGLRATAQVLRLVVHCPYVEAKAHKQRTYVTVIMRQG